MIFHFRLPPQINTEDYFNRYLEFQSFERQFAHCLSNTAVKTKFKAHTDRGKSIIKSVANILAEVWESRF